MPVLLAGQSALQVLSFTWAPFSHSLREHFDDSSHAPFAWVHLFLFFHSWRPHQSLFFSHHSLREHIHTQYLSMSLVFCVILYRDYELSFEFYIFFPSTLFVNSEKQDMDFVKNHCFIFRAGDWLGSYRWHLAMAFYAVDREQWPYKEACLYLPAGVHRG